MINGKKIFAYSWNSCEAIDKLIDHLNTLSLSEEQFNKLESLISDVITAYSGMKEEVWGEDA